MRKRTGFTLIELLIVIAIIAILALIAIPNFLEAQTRSKVSRAKADMRSLSLAVEAYQVDNNTYIQSICPDTDPELAPENGGQAYYPNGATDSWGWYGRLTTPVAYITSIPLDPFGKPLGKSWTGSKSTNVYHFYSGNGQSYPSLPAALPGYFNAPRTMWLLISQGPNLLTDTEVDHGGADCYMLFNPLPAGNHPEDDSWLGVFYDPTNGTISFGDIYRWSGPANILPRTHSNH